MKNLILIISLIFFSANPIFAKVISGGISLTDKLPTEIFGSWKVSAIQTYTNNSNKYRYLPSIEYWNIYKNDNVLTLENPQSGARASVTVKEVVNNTVSFTRESKKVDSEITETPTITIIGENFFGTDKMVIKNYKNGELISTDVVEFTIRGQKTGGVSTAKLLK